MSGDDRQVGVELTADNRQYDQSMAASTQQTEDLNKQVDSLGSKLDGLAKRAGRKLQIFGAVDIAGITATSYAAARFEKQMSGLQAQSAALDKTMGNGTKTFGTYKDAVNDMRKDFPVATDEAASLVKTISGLSDSTAPITELAGSFTKLAGATGESSTELSRGVLQLGRQMGTSSKDVNDYNNTILKLSANSGQSAGSLLQFAQTLSPAGRQLKMSEKDILGISSAFGKAGQDGTLAANAFSVMANNISYAAQSGSPELKQYADLIGVTQEQFKNMDSTEAFVDMFDALNKQGSDAINTLNRFGLDGQRTMRGLQAVSQQGGLRSAIDDANEGMNEGGKTLDESSKAAFGGLSDETKKLRNSMSQNAETFGAPFAKIAGQFVKGMTKISEAAGVVINGPLGKLAQLAAGIVGPLALLAGTLLTLSKSLAAVAGVKFLAGSGLAGLAATSGIGGRFTKKMAANSEEDYTAGKLNKFQSGMYLGGRTAGEKISASRDASRARGVGRLMKQGYAPAAAEATMAARPGMMNRAGAMAARSVGFAAKMGSDMYAPAWGGPRSMGLDGMDSHSQRPRVARSEYEKANDPSPSRGRGMWATTRANFNEARGDALSRGTEKLATKAGLQGPRLEGGEYFKKNADRTAAAAQTAAQQATKETAKQFKSMGNAVGGATKQVGKFHGSLLLASAGVGKDVGRAGMGMGKALGGAIATSPIMLGILGYTAGSMIYDKFKDKSSGVEHEDYKDFLSEYVGKAGISSGGRDYTPKSGFEKLRATQQSGTMEDALDVDSTSKKIAKSPEYKLLEKRLKGTDSMDEALQRIAPMYSSMGNVPSSVLSDLKNDFVNKFGAKEAQRGVDALQSSDVDSIDGGNIANQLKFDPEAFAPKAKHHRFSPDGIKKKSIDDNFEDQYAAVTARANAAYRTTGSDEAYRREFRGNFMKGMDENFIGKGKASKMVGGGFDSLDMHSGEQDALTKKIKKAFNIKVSDQKSALAMLGSDNTAEYFTALQGMNVDLGGQFHNKMGTKNPMQEEEGKDRKKQIELNKKILEKQETGYDISKEPADLRKAKKTIDDATGSSTVSGMLYGKGGKGGTDAMKEAIDKEGNLSLQYDAILELTKKVKGTTEDDYSDLASASERTRHAAQVAPAGAQQNLLMGAEQLMDRNMQIQMSRMNPIDAAKASYQRLESLKADKPKKRAGENAEDLETRTQEHAGKIQAAEGDVESKKTAGEEMIKQVTIQKENFDISMKQGLEDYNLTRARSQEAFGRQQAQAQESYGIQRARAYENFNLQRKHAEADFEKNRKRAQANYDLQVRYSNSDYNKQRRRAQENYDLSIRYSNEDYEKSRKRAQVDFDLQRSYSEADFTKQRKRSIKDHALQEKYSLDDFNLQRKYGEEDFQHQVVLMTKQTAKSVYDIYKRVDVQRTVSSRNLLMNSADQLDRMKKQEENLKRLRSMGMSKESIQQLGLTDADKSQQLERLVGEVTDDPSIIKEFNQQIVKRLDAAKKLVTDDSSAEWEEMTRQHDQSLERSQDAFDKNLERSRTAYKQSLEYQDEDYATSMERQSKNFSKTMFQQAVDYQESMFRQAKAHAKTMAQQATDYKVTMDRQAKAFKKSMKENSDDFEESMERNSAQFAKTMHQMAADFTRSTKLARQNFGIQMDQMAVNFEKTRKRAKDSFEKANEDLFRSGKDILETQGKNMNKTAKRIKKEILDSLDGIGSSGSKKIHKIGSDWAEMSGGKNPFNNLRKQKGMKRVPGLGWATGGPVHGDGTGTSDQIDAKLSNNEHVLTAKNVEGMGGHSKVEEMRKSADRGQFHNQYPQKFASGGRVMPIRGYSAGSLNTGYPGHTGVDFRVGMGTPVYSVGDGKAYPKSLRGNGQGRGPKGYRSFGIYYDVNHGGYSSRYAHLSKHVRREGSVRAGDFLGYSGSSGNSTGPHMHFELPGKGAMASLKFLRAIGAGGHYGKVSGKGFVGSSDGLDNGVTLYLQKKYKDLEKKAKDFPAFGGFTSGLMSKAVNKNILSMVKRLSKSSGIDYDVQYSKNRFGLEGSPGGGANSKGAVMGSKALQAVVRRALGMAGLPTNSRYINAWVRQAMSESGGNPAIRQQIVDVNSFNGSGGAMGLMQTIPPTFNSYKMKGHGNIFNALDNSIAAMRYATSRYGRKGQLGVIGHGHGYSEGTEHAKAGWKMVGENGPELMHFKGGEKVWNKRQVAMATQINDGASRRNNAVGSQPIVNNNYNSTKIDKSTTFTGSISVSASDPGMFLKQIKQQQRQQALTNPTMAGDRS